jgi:hypothetical protein
MAGTVTIPVPVVFHERTLNLSEHRETVILKSPLVFVGDENEVVVSSNAPDK